LVVGDVVRLANVREMTINEIPEFSAQASSMRAKEVIA
jgi:hypothetical protein